MAEYGKPGTAAARFVAFHSCQGGVGRTLALANCARVLAASGQRVVLMDFDLEAPGLQHFSVFAPKGTPKQAHPGFAEYLAACVGNEPPDSLKDYLYECKGCPEDQGRVWLMPAGNHGEPHYRECLDGCTWNEFYTRRDGYRILENLRGHLIAEYRPDYVFMDTHAGFSELSGIATHQLADIAVLVFSLGEPNLRGTLRVFHSLRQTPLRPRIVLAASPVPAVPMDKGSPFYEKMQWIRREFQDAAKPSIIPYHPVLAFDGRIVVDERDDPFSCGLAYRKLVDMIREAADAQGGA
jgi:MinD-like ATPase involved in chromosome partitioning or flagellar assembly